MKAMPKKATCGAQVRAAAAVRARGHSTNLHRGRAAVEPRAKHQNVGRRF
jgi:hypothetical protein